MTLERKLVAVVMADVVGYSRLMERDESGTHTRLRELREFIVSKATAVGGRLVKTAGDGFLLEFASATAALRWAIDVQRELATRAEGVDEDTKLQLRVGINLGDIIVEGDDILGDGVNVAARLETLAEPGGICVAAAVKEQVREDLGVTFVDAGEQYVKNISKPVYVYHVGLNRRPGGAWPPQPPPAWRVWLARRRDVVVATVLGLALVTAVPVLLSKLDAPTEAASSALSIRVAPFSAPAGDSRLIQLAEAVGTDLARVMADTMRDVRIVREGDARYAVEGDLRTSGGDVTIALQLVDVAERKQLDNDRASMPLADAESNRERFVHRALIIARDLVDGAENRRVAGLSRPPSTPREMAAKAAWLSSNGDLESIREARRLYDEALRRDPALLTGLLGRAGTFLEEFRFDYVNDTRPLVTAMDRDTLAALALDPRDPMVWYMRAFALLLQGRFDAALEANVRARSIDPTRFYGQQILLYQMTGRADEVLGIVKERNALMGPADPDFRWHLCHSYLLLGRYAEAIGECELAVVNDDTYWIWIDLAAAYAHSGAVDKATKAKGEILRRVPAFTVSRLERKRMSNHPTYLQQMREHVYAGLRKAGVPE